LIILIGTPSSMAAPASPASEPPAAFRKYAEEGAEEGADAPRADTVRTHYRLMRANQNFEFVKAMEQRWLPLDKTQLTVRECFEHLKSYVDTSDPDTDLPNMVHMIQTAEAMRAAGEPDWMVLMGLVHDLGKAMCLLPFSSDAAAPPPTSAERAAVGQLGTAEGPQFALGGDTWIVGAPIPQTAVFPEFNALCADSKVDEFSRGETGRYRAGVGMMSDELHFAFGHDEYIYRAVRKHQNETAPAAERLPEEAFAILRLHSCYPWHSGGSYRAFHGPDDERLLKAVQRFQRYDLYTKHGAKPDVEALWPYYQSLVDRFLPGKMWW